MSKFFDAKRQLNVLDYHVHQSTVTTSKLAHLVCAQQCIKMHTNATFLIITFKKVGEGGITSPRALGHSIITFP